MRLTHVPQPLRFLQAYDIADQQSKEDHATEIDAYDQNGKLVRRQADTWLRGGVRTRRSLRQAVLQMRANGAVSAFDSSGDERLVRRGLRWF